MGGAAPGNTPRPEGYVDIPSVQTIKYLRFSEEVSQLSDAWRAPGVPGDRLPKGDRRRCSRLTLM